MKSVTIRSARPEDAQRLCEIFAYYVENTAISFEHTAPSREEFKTRIADTLRKYPYLVLEEDGLIRGYAYAGAYRKQAAYSRCVELSIYLERGAQGCGYGRMLYEALEEALKQMGILNLYACIADPVEEDEYLTRNSEEFHRHLGFALVGRFHQCGYKFGRWYNMIWMEKCIGEHQ